MNLRPRGPKPRALPTAPLPDAYPHYTVLLAKGKRNAWIGYRYTLISFHLPVPNLHLKSNERKMRSITMAYHAP